MAGARQRFTATFGVLRIPDVRRLWLSQSLSEVGDWAARLALAVLVYDQSGSALWSAVTLAVSYLPYLFSPLTTSLAQRWSLRRLMIGADLIRLGLFAAIALPLPTWSLLAIAFLAAVPAPPFEAARLAVTPEAAGSERLGDAIALTNITFQVAQVVGFGVAGVLLHFVGAQSALLLNAGTFALSAFVLLGLQSGRRLPEPEPPLTRTRKAFSQIASTLLLRRIILLILLLAFADAAVNALLPVFVRSNDYSPLLLTALAATAPLVGALTGTVVPRDGANRHLLRTSALLTVVGGGSAAVLFLLIGSGATWRGALIAILAIVAFGVTIAADIPTMAASMRIVDEDLRASFVSLIQPALMGTQAVGALIAGLLAVSLSATTTMTLSLVIPVAYGCWVLLRLSSTADVINLRAASTPGHQANEQIDVESTSPSTRPMP